MCAILGFNRAKRASKVLSRSAVSTRPKRIPIGIIRVGSKSQAEMRNGRDKPGRFIVLKAVAYSITSEKVQRKLL
jgi:hypothetical protein